MVAASLCLAGAALFLEQYAFGTDHTARRGQPQLIGRIDVDRGGGPLIIPVDVLFGDPNQEPRRATYRMLLDTGATCTVFDSRHRQMLGRPIGRTLVQTPSGKCEAEKFEAPAICVGGITIYPGINVPCFNLRPVADGIGEPVDGLLGMDILGGQPFRIDFDEGAVEFYEAVGPQFGRPVPIVWNNAARLGAPFVVADVGDGVREHFLIDTGGATPMAGTLNVQSYQRLMEAGQLLPVRPDWKARLWTAGKVVDGKVVRAPRFVMGGDAHNAMFVTFPYSCLGLGYLSRYIVTFDFSNSVMYLRPGKAFKRADAFDFSGLLPGRADDGHVVTVAAFEGAPAAAAGIKKGDVILAIDGRSSNKMSLFAFRRILAAEGRHVLRVARDGVERDVALALGPKR